MQASKRISTPDKLTSEIQLARIRLAKTESQLESAKEQARIAKRRRKEAKEAARRAKKQARLAKREVVEAKLVLAEAEAKLAQTGRSAAKAKARRKAAAKAAASPRKKQPVRPAASPAPKSVKTRQPATKPVNPVSSAGPVAGTAQPGIPVPRGFESPGAAVSMPGSPATAPTGQAIQEKPSTTTEPAKPVEPALKASQGL